MVGYHTRRVRPEEAAEDPERIAIREALAFGKALYDIRTELGLTVAELAARADMTDDDIEEGGTEPTVPLLRRLAAALNATVHLTPGHDLGSRPSPRDRTRCAAALVTANLLPIHRLRVSGNESLDSVTGLPVTLRMLCRLTSGNDCWL
ncbi:MAG: helix-turn-helix domain-containing protein [Trebonia sp.]